jgi:hypothetical protein
MKTELYSWSVSADLKSALEREARRRKVSLSAVLDQAAKEWLLKSGAGNDDDEQRRLQRAASKCFGAFASGDTRRSESVNQLVRCGLQWRYER